MIASYIILSLIGCATFSQKSVTESEYQSRIDGDSSYVELQSIEGVVVASGWVINDGLGEPSLLKVGLWKEFYDNGILRSEGIYQVGRYTDCCIAGPCKESYNFKVGNWKYFYPKGGIKAAGEYEVKKWPIITSCEGGDEIEFGMMGSNWKFYNELGQSVSMPDSIKSEFEVVRTEDEYHYLEYSIIDGMAKYSYIAKEIKN